MLICLHIHPHSLSPARPHLYIRAGMSIFFLKSLFVAGEVNRKGMVGGCGGAQMAMLLKVLRCSFLLSQQEVIAGREMINSDQKMAALSWARIPNQRQLSIS